MAGDEAPGPSAYEALGGEAGVRAILTELYDRLFVDPIVGFFFAGKDKQHIVDAQLPLTCAFLGGPQRYTGRPLPEVHAALPLLPGHFDRRHRVLAEVLNEHGAPEGARDRWLAVDAGLRTSVLSAGESARKQTMQQKAD